MTLPDFLRTDHPSAASRGRDARMPFPERGDMDATDRFFHDETEDEDEGDDFTWTERHERPF
jgi:hypothetical protein